MKKIFCTILTILLLIPVFGYVKTEDVFADGAYEVAYIEDNGNLTKVASYGDFASAKNKMKENKDYVVRHPNSQSPSKIIAMNSGFVYSYPYRRGYSTMNIYETVNSSLVGTGVTTYVAEHYEMTYHSTYYYHESKGLGFVEVTLNGFHGYCDLEYTDLVPAKYIEKNLPITLGGGDITGSGEEPFSVKIKQNYYYVKENNGYRDLVFCYHRAWSKTNGGDCLESESTIGVAPSFMSTGAKYYSNDGINFYSDGKLTNKVGTYYNYYQFLPLRTKTNITAEQMNGFLNAHTNSTSVILGQGQAFVNAQNKYGCNASTILCMAIHEAAWGTSNIARGKNNLFGWGAYDDATSNATKYDSVEACVNAQMADNLANYMDVQCARYFSMSLGNKGGGFILKYASDPYWAEKIASHYYALDKFAGGNNGNLVDFNKYQLAVVNTKNAAVKDSPNGNTLYKTANKSGYQKNLIVTPLGEENGYTKVQLSNPKDDSEVIYPITLPYGTLVEYHYSKSIGYIKTSDLIVLDKCTTLVDQNTGDYILPSINVDPSLLQTMATVYSAKLSDISDILSISGYGLIKGLNFNKIEEIKHELVFKNANDTKDEYIYLLNSIKDTVNLNDNHSYEYVGFNGDLNLNELPLGKYLVYLRITNGSYTKDVILKSSKANYSNIVSNSSGYSSRLITNKSNSYRFEYSKLNTPIDYSIINKKRNTPSIFSYDSMVLDENNVLKVQAMAYIPGVNFNENTNVQFKVYLINDNSNYKTIDATIVDNPIDYNNIYKTSYDLSKITYQFSIDLNEINDTYYLITEIKSTDNGTTYIDYLEMNNKANLTLPETSIGEKEFKVIINPDKTRTILTCEYIDQVESAEIE